jgi:hypothetical protein
MIPYNCFCGPTVSPFFICVTGPTGPGSDSTGTTGPTGPGSDSTGTTGPTGPTGTNGRLKGQ